MISKGMIVTKIIFSGFLINLRKIQTSFSRILGVFFRDTAFLISRGHFVPPPPAIIGFMKNIASTEPL